MKKLIAFDLDGTLAESKQPLDDEMAALLARLSQVADICVMSGGDWPQFDKQVVSRLPGDADRTRFWIMPTTGTKLYRFEDGEWTRRFADLFDEHTRKHIVDELQAAIERLGLKPDRTWGEQVEDRGSQITFSALGQQAPGPEKERYDPDQAKRRAIVKELAPKLPEQEVRIGGATSIDVTRKGVDKASGIERLATESRIPKADMLFLGDALYEGGNDAPVRDVAHVDSIQVGSIAETKRAVEAIALCLKA